MKVCIYRNNIYDENISINTIRQIDYLLVRLYLIIACKS